MKIFVMAICCCLMAAAKAAPKASTDLFSMTIDDVMKGYRTKAFTSVQLVTAYLGRINEVNSIFNAVLEINPDALTIAAALDLERNNGNARGPLHGIPILIKDNIATFDKMNNTAGSYALLGAKVPKDSTLAAKLRAAGAIILGKTALSQWANYRSYNSSNGWNARGGQVYGAYIPKQDPSGSSSGSGVSAALGLATVTLGSETDGSINSPSQRNSIVGMKPTVGLTSRYLVIPISAHQDSVGPMCRTVKDAAYVLSAIAGFDSADNYTSKIPWTAMPDYVGACKETGLSGVKVGVPRQLFSVKNNTAQPAVLAAFEAALITMKGLGANVKDVVMSGFDEYQARARINENLVLQLDFKLNLQQYLSQLTKNPNNITSLQSLDKYTMADPREMYKSRDTGIWKAALNLTYSISDQKGYNIAMDQKYLASQVVDLTLQLNKVDVLVIPSDFASKIAAIDGHPIITVPLGFYPVGTPTLMNARGNLVARGVNFPFGIAFVSRKFSEEKLFAYAYAFEQASMARDLVKPYVLPKTQLVFAPKVDDPDMDHVMPKTDLYNMTIDDVMMGYRMNTLTAVQLVTAYLGRINEVNSIFNAVLEINPDALMIAAALDLERTNGKVRGPLHGIPILIKDNIATFDKMNNTAGSYALLGAKVPKDSTLAAKLRAAGAIILGKTALSQWANYRSYNSSNGWNARGGQVYGAFIAKQDPSGSSSGSGVSAALGLAMVTLGSETDGSIISPSQRNSIVGMKPTVGLTSRYLVIPISAHQDSVGPMCRTVKDAAYVLSAIAGFDSADNYTSKIPWTVMPDYVGACKKNGLAGVKVGVPRQLFPTAQPAVLAAFEAALITMKGLGAVAKNVSLSGFDQYQARARINENLVLQLDFKLNLQQYLSQLTKNPNNITSLQSLDKYTMADPREMYKSRDTGIWKAALALNYSISDMKGYNIAQDQKYLASQVVDLTLLLNKVDVLVLPSDFASKIAAIDGHPIITVPLGFYPVGTPTLMNARGNLVARGVNFPFGIAFVSRKFSEEKLFAYAYAFEQASMAQAKVKPYILPKTQIVSSPSMTPTAMPTMNPSNQNAKTTIVAIKQTISGITYADSVSASFKIKLTAALIASLNLPAGTVIRIDSITYVSARRQLLADSVVVAYTVTGTDVPVSTITTAAAATVTSGSLTTQLQPDYPAASAQTQPTTTDVSPSSAPTMDPTTAPKSGCYHQTSVSSFIAISAIMLTIPYILL